MEAITLLALLRDFNLLRFLKRGHTDNEAIDMSHVKKLENSGTNTGEYQPRTSGIAADLMANQDAKTGRIHVRHTAEIENLEYITVPVFRGEQLAHLMRAERLVHVARGEGPGEAKDPRSRSSAIYKFDGEVRALP